MSHLKVLGIDLAKNVFQVHGATAQGKKLFSKRLSRGELMEFVTNLQPCLIGIEACGGAHYWARTFEAMGHTVKMMAPQFVKPYVKSNKNDRNDAAAIAEAVTRPDMKFVGIKTIEHQNMLLLHRARALVMKQRTAQVNQIRGLLAEYGIIIPKNIQQLNHLPTILEKNKHKLNDVALGFFERLNTWYKTLNAEVKKYDKEIEIISKKDPMCKALIEMRGVGPISASAAVATIGNANAFNNGRELAAWLGLVPKQHSSGNTIRLGRISKRGDRYLRTLLVHGARSVIKTCGDKKDTLSLWLQDKREKCGYNKSAVALANKNARIIWAILKTGECYREAA